MKPLFEQRKQAAVFTYDESGPAKLRLLSPYTFFYLAKRWRDGGGEWVVESHLSLAGGSVWPSNHWRGWVGVCLEVPPDQYCEGLAVKCCPLLNGVVALDWRWTCTFLWLRWLYYTDILENVEHCGGEIQEYYVTDELMSDVLKSSKFKFLMFSASWHDGPLTI